MDIKAASLKVQYDRLNGAESKEQPLLNSQWVVLRVKGGREPGEANP
jgi:hypothetical protein